MRGLINSEDVIKYNLTAKMRFQNVVFGFNFMIWTTSNEQMKCEISIAIPQKTIPENFQIWSTICLQN
jgi:hypothetical protein